MLLAAIEDTEFPSPAMLARVESGIGDVATLEQYIERLMDKAQGRFPNLQLAEPYEQIAFKYDSQIYGLKKLMVPWFTVYCVPKKVSLPCVMLMRPSTAGLVIVPRSRRLASA